ncbi:CLCN3 [Cordylochernes scorpioides]|uniref:CLCN3 n=1 Tax=Cordylochernes scorpioides TaxID=51811 RepID=A0ABY6KDS9_9ARAC|nr:CLCN3 [Cordylochernes scorpioides]
MEDQRICIKFCVKNRFKDAEIFWKLQTAYGDAVMSRRRVFEWYKRFKEGCRRDRRQRATLGKKRPFSIEATTDDPELLKRVITGDETWIYGFDLETTQQASEWRFKNEPRPKKARKAPSKAIVMLTVFFDYQGIVHHEFQQQGSTITADSYLGVLRRLREAIRQKRPELWRSKSWILHHDNAPAHTALKISKKFHVEVESGRLAIDLGLRVVNGIGKKREAESNGQKFQVDRPRPVRTPATVSKVKRLATTENPPSQRQLSTMCGTSLKTINNIIHKDLELDTRRKGKVHKLTPFHMKNRATNARKLYEEHLAGSRSEYTATLDEAWMYVTYCNGIRKICYIKRGNQVPDNWVHQCSETFPKGFMVVGVMTGRGVLPLIKVPSKVKVNSEFYIECVLKPVIEQLKDLYPGEMDKVFLHHDKASSHTSNKTQQFLQEMKDTLGLNFIRNSDIPVKSPDASPLDFYGFGMLKQRLFNRRPKTEAGLWKAAQEEWSNVSLSKVKEVFAAWKVRCREIVKKKGKHIEHMKKIHVRKIKF